MSDCHVIFVLLRRGSGGGRGVRMLVGEMARIFLFCFFRIVLVWVGWRVTFFSSSFFGCFRWSSESLSFFPLVRLMGN